jgi:hypothetical protein
VTSAELETVEDLLATLRPVPGWAVLKGWTTLPSLPGDLDLIVAPTSVSALEGVIEDWLREQSGFAFWCRHIPHCPRLFAYLPQSGFADRYLEIDLAELVPLAGWRCVTFDRLHPHIDSDARGFPHTSRAALDALEMLYKPGAPGHPPSPGPEQAVLASLLGSRTARLHLRPGRPAAVVVRAILTARAITDPRFVAQRFRFRCRSILGGCCAFDPAGGRAVRLVPDEQTARAKASRDHTVWNLGPAPS